MPIQATSPEMGFPPGTEFPRCPGCQSVERVYFNFPTRYFYCGKCSIWFQAPIKQADEFVSLRDGIMMAALPALITEDSHCEPGRTCAALVREAYEFADAALAVRNEPKEQA